MVYGGGVTGEVMVGWKDRISEAQRRAQERGRQMREDAREGQRDAAERREELKDEWRQQRDDRHEQKESRPTGALSEVGRTDDGGLRCPNCGGTQFKAKRSGKAKVIGGLTVGLGALAAPKSRVKCVTCGEEFKRG